jgi:hypothetical protein
LRASLLIEDTGAVVDRGTPEQFGACIRREQATWAKVIEAAKVPRE